MMDLSSDEIIAEEEFLEMQRRYNQRMRQVSVEVQPVYVNTFQPRSTMELRTLELSTITNLHEFANIHFYHKKNVYKNAEFLLKKGNVQYLVADNYKLYTVLNNQLVQGQFLGKAQCWALPTYN